MIPTIALKQAVILTPEQYAIEDHIAHEDGMILVSAGPGCVDKDTEYLTPNGWKYINEYTEGEKVAQWNPDNSIEFVEPKAYVVRPTGPLNHIKSNTVDMVISDGHRVPYFTNKGVFKTKQFYELRDVGRLCIPRIYNKIVNPSRSEIPEELLRVLVMQSADGSRIKNIKEYKISIRVNKERKKVRVIKLLEDAGIKYSATNENGYLRVVYYPPKIIAFKGLESLWSCNNEQLKIVGEEAALWDGCYTERTNVTSMRFTGNKQDAELVQHAWHILTGKYVTLTLDPRVYVKDPIYTVYVSNRTTSYLKFKEKASITPYETSDGLKYCFSMPSTFWLARRNGKVFPTGNTGKTFMAERIIIKIEPKRALYTAFNKAIVEEAREKFSNYGVECRTLHAIAHKYTKPNKNIRPTNYSDLPDNAPYNVKYKVMQALDAFFVSSSHDMWEFFHNYFTGEAGEEILTNMAIAVVEGMLDKTIPWSFSFMLKYFHLMLVEDPSICQYDLVILDEINDTTAVALEIFKLIQAPKKLGLGDPNQAIYSFMNLVNGFEELKDVPIFPLTNSFRCSKEIASKIERIMQKEVDKTVSFTGTDNPVANGKTLYCTMTNASIIMELDKRIAERKPFILLRKPVDIFACSLAVLSASVGKEVYQTQYKFLEDVYTDWVSSDRSQKSFFTYVLAELNDQEIHSAVRLIISLRQRNINLFSLYNEVKTAKQGGDYTVATVYTSKGLEFESVKLADEFDAAIAGIRANGGIQTEDDLVVYRCYYVAASRAGVNLSNARSLLK